MPKSRERAVRLFILVLICVAITSGLGNRILSNYFKEVYQVTSAQRGFIEIPRESPGILCMVLVAGLGFLGNIRLGILAQIMMLAGLMVMGFLSPGYGVMLIFLFLYSLGEHLFMPLSDSISMDLARDGKVGTALGKFKGVTTMASMVASCAVFVGFRAGFFSFQSRAILPFAIGACMTLQGGEAVLRDAFGVVALVAMAPLITIQLLGFRAIVSERIAERRAMKRILDADDQQIINFM